MRTNVKRFVCKASLIAAALIPAAGCHRQPETARTAGPYVPTATIKDLMDAIVDPSADVVWDSVATIVGGSTEDRRPSTDAEWAEVRQGAIRLVEASNLLLMPGRHIAPPGVKSETPGVELEPEEMEALVNKDRNTWDARVRAFRDVSVEVLQTIEARNADKLFDVGGELDTTCENCHRQYWYPNEKIPDLPAQAGSETP